MAAAAAAAAAPSSKKRKLPAGLADPSSLRELTSGLPTIDACLAAVADSLDDWKASVQSAVEAAELEAKRLVDEIKGMIEGSGGVLEHGILEEYLRLNVGGRVLSFPYEALVHPELHNTVVAQMLLYFRAALPQDAAGNPFVDSFDGYFDRLADQVSMVYAGQLGGLVLFDPEAADPAHAEPHAIFATKLDLTPPVNTPATPPAGNDRSLEGLADVADRALAGVKRRIMALRNTKWAYEKLIDFLGPFLKSGNVEEDTIVSVQIRGETVSTVKATLNRLGTNHALYNRFDTDAVAWSGADVRKTSFEHFRRIVDFARRQRTGMAGSAVKPPVVQASMMEALEEDCTMYGIKKEEFRTSIASASEVKRVLTMMDKRDRQLKLLYKMSRDGAAYTDLLNGVGDASGLLFVIQDGSTHKFSAFIDGPLAQPADPTRHKVSRCPISLYSISGAYDAPTKIPLPAEKPQSVAVAGREGAVLGSSGQSSGNVYIGEMGAAVLWLGKAEPGPAADLRSCHVWVTEAHLPPGYRGAMDEGKGILATDKNFTATEIDVLSLV
ncbi:unnamed protein product [Vitrella brassicaformis CCMP3155]|uniref:TLDc domain-containing protein n=2 Tax=Vitrella brassicaformis TaxID=1169539 RepID=A0A0G4FWL4_VITBC|nr:unnamed protein product [Vitrella brassicaformis CCMP3155]|eukprot:CEM19311.1 unnamed protein product [Vitrella brassicaformis CCMP3155]